MPALTEGELEFDFPGAIQAVQFDDGGHGLSHCMKAVDFIVELADRYLFVEVKDPANSKATAEAQAGFVATLTSGALCKALTGKLRDSLLYRWAEDRLDKDVYYLVLLELPQPHDPAHYVTITDALKRDLPLNNVPASWTKPLVKGAAVLDMAKWNALGAYGAVKRVP